MKAAGIPPYLRFDVNLSYIYSRGGRGAINERFEWVQMILQPFKKSLTESKFKFLGSLSDSDLFKDSSTLLDQINKLLQIFTRCRVYKFRILSHIIENISAHFLAAILQFDAIVRCSKIKVGFGFWSSKIQMSFPTEAIGNWLNRTSANGQKDNERFLKLEINDSVPNLGEMLEYLKKVCHFFVKLLQMNV